MLGRARLVFEICLGCLGAIQKCHETCKKIRYMSRVSFGEVRKQNRNIAEHHGQPLFLELPGSEFVSDKSYYFVNPLKRPY